MKRRAIASGVVALGVALAVIGPTPASAKQLRTHAADPLVGTWQTGLLPLANVRATLTAHGYTAKQVENYLHRNNHFVDGLTTRIRFYRENGVPFQIVYAWDRHTTHCRTAITALIRGSRAAASCHVAPIHPPTRGARRSPTR